jgi:hypothetical protein
MFPSIRLKGLNYLVRHSLSNADGFIVGTMVEWGNYWAKAIRMRDYKQTEAYAGMFSQIGELYNVKVRYRYKSHPTSPNLIASCGQVSFHHVAQSHSIMKPKSHPIKGTGPRHRVQ